MRISIKCFLSFRTSKAIDYAVDDYAVDRIPFYKALPMGFLDKLTTKWME